MNVLITGGTGTLGRAFVRAIINHAERICILSRDERKQFDFRRELGNPPHVNWFLGDIRDQERVLRATWGVDFIIHAAALKQVTACEYDPFEAIQTNILGTQNVITAGIDNRVKRIVGISSDKAVNPISLYGATKLCAEKLFIAANNYCGGHPTRFVCVRYGNVLGSRGSFIEGLVRGTITTVTDRRMSRFWLPISHAVEIVLRALAVKIGGGEIFVPELPSARPVDFLKAFDLSQPEETGIRQGEKLHETLIAPEEIGHSLYAHPIETQGRGEFIILPENPQWGRVEWHGRRPEEVFPEYRLLETGYRSDRNWNWLMGHDLKSIIHDHWRQFLYGNTDSISDCPPFASCTNRS